MSSGLLITFAVVAAVAATLAVIYFALIKGTRADRPPARSEHRPGPGRS